jgi:ankyrin repeat protein
MTAILIAGRNGSVEILQLLLQAGADIFKRNKVTYVIPYHLHKLHAS